MGDPVHNRDPVRLSPGDILAVLVCVGTLCDVCTKTKLPNDAFSRTPLSLSNAWLCSILWLCYNLFTSLFMLPSFGCYPQCYVNTHVVLTELFLKVNLLVQRTWISFKFLMYIAKFFLIVVVLFYHAFHTASFSYTLAKTICCLYLSLTFYFSGNEKWYIILVMWRKCHLVELLLIVWKYFTA